MVPVSFSGKKRFMDTFNLALCSFLIFPNYLQWISIIFNILKCKHQKKILPRKAGEKSSHYRAPSQMRVKGHGTMGHFLGLHTSLLASQTLAGGEERREGLSSHWDPSPEDTQFSPMNTHWSLPTCHWVLGWEKSVLGLCSQGGLSWQ